MKRTGPAIAALVIFVLFGLFFCCARAEACAIVADSDPTATWDASDGAIYYSAYQVGTNGDLLLGTVTRPQMALSRRMVWTAGQDVAIYVTASNDQGESDPTPQVCFNQPVICLVDTGYTNEVPPQRCTARLP